jgi:hypothetical protein
MAIKRLNELTPFALVEGDFRKSDPVAIINNHSQNFKIENEESLKKVYTEEDLRQEAIKWIKREHKHIRNMIEGMYHTKNQKYFNYSFDKNLGFIEAFTQFFDITEEELK